MVDEQEFYHYIFRNAAEGILITDAQGLLQQVNPAATAMLGVAIDQLIGKKPQDCFYNNGALLNLFTRSGEQILDVHLPKRRLAVGLASPIQRGRRLVMLQDVTEQRELESRREALVKTLAHDLRNPIGAISGYADLVAKLGDLNAQQERYLNRVRQTAAKLHDITEALVDLAWIEAGMPMAHVPIELSQTITRVVNDLRELAYGRKITIAVSVQTPMPPIVGDPQRLQRVIYNLLHNAIIYSQSEQTVAIHAWGDTNEVYVSVADQGFGISDDELALIFDRMYRSRDERLREIPGGGLGLTVARTIIQRHGGSIWASSNLGEGSTFTFFLPAVNRQG